MIAASIAIAMIHNLPGQFRLIAMLAIVFCGRTAHGLDVTGVHWGFDGRLVPLAFNPVTVDVLNDSGEPFQGSLQFRQGDSSLDGDLPIVEPDLYIEAGGTRRLQFFPFITELPGSASLEWEIGGAKKRISLINDMQTLKFGSPTVVLLIDPVFARGVTARLPTFDEDIFPISVAGMEGLQGVVLDHLPRWDALRMQALRDWIEAGGTLHLFQGDTGEIVKFPAPLEVCNEPSERIDVGAGRVVRHASRVAVIDENFARNALGFGGLNEDRDSYNSRAEHQYEYQWSTVSSLPSMLRSLTRPHHNWGLIYLLSFSYLAIVFPGCWLLGRRRADFRVTYPVLIGAVVLFSLAFKTVGQRGYGEETAWNAVGIARPLGEGRWLTQCWSNAFVTAGGEYTYRHDADGLLYSTGGTNDARGGFSQNRPSASLTADIPPFSSLTIVHEAVVPGPDVRLRVESVDRSGGQARFRIAVEGTLPPGNIRALYKSDVLTLNRTDSMLETISQSTFTHYLQATGYDYGFGYNADSGLRAYEMAEMSLVARALRIRNDEMRNGFSLPDDRVRVLIYGDADPEFLDVENGPPKRQGRVLYVIDLPIPPADNTTVDAPAGVQGTE